MSKTYKLTCIAVLSALSVIANFCTIPLPGNNAVSFTLAVCFFTGIYFGILPAMAVGYIGDLVAHLIHPLGEYNWFMALSITLYGVICALVYKAKAPKSIKLVVSAVICYIVCLCGLNSFGLWLQYVVALHPGPWGVWQLIAGDHGVIKKTFWVYMLARAPMSAVNLAVNTVIVGILQESSSITKLVTRLKREKSQKTATASSDEEKQ